MNADVHVEWWIVYECMLFCFRYVYEWLMHRSMFYVLSNLVTALYVCMFMFMGLDARMIDVW